MTYKPNCSWYFSYLWFFRFFNNEFFIFLDKTDFSSQIHQIPILIAGIGGIFNVDLEDSALDSADFTEVAKSVVKSDDFISAKQVKRLYTLCTQNGVDAETAAKIIADAGYKSAKEVRQRSYDEICNKIESFSETVVEGEVVNN